MAKQILIRSIPEKLDEWIEQERYRQRATKQEFVLHVLEEAYSYGQGGPLRQPSLFDSSREPVPYSGDLHFKFNFIDLFAGIGGFRLGLEAAGGHCAFSCEWDLHSQRTYLAWFGEEPHGDIRDLDPTIIPDHDVLAAGFPCQPFSIAGVSKKKSLGRAHGFKDLTQGTLFFHLATIVEIKRPPVLFLENVKNLLSHDEGRTWNVIKSTLEALDYEVFKRVVDACHYVPQHRERVYIVCFDRKTFGSSVPFQFPSPPAKCEKKLCDILETEPEPKYTLSDHLWSYLQDYAKKHKAKGNGFGFGLTDLDGITRTLSARYYKDGSEILIPQGERQNPRRLTPREAARLMGYPDNLKIVVSDTQAYRQFGNAVVPCIVEAIGREIGKVLKWHLDKTGNGCLVKARNGYPLPKGAKDGVS